VSVRVRTRSGFVTSYREAWKDGAGRTVWTWRTDGPEPLDFGTVEQAEQWIAEVWHDAHTKAEKADRDAWSVEVVT
jgi:hypothetical protein